MLIPPYYAASGGEYTQKRLKLYSYLPSKRYKRQERGKRRQRIIIPQRISIHQRDAIATKKVEVGNFEADLTFHKGNQSMNIGALVDNKESKDYFSAE
ncbi:hypothetical protein [Rickettsia endosymbiont of Gonocerus acuteangulatus]|uniref:hypothetical protein n=1 Tax=Rickettsia endosymbiont of Gonocerus acuteangulatus TaxID=3066266 RepID=UPI0031334E7D